VKFDQAVRSVLSKYATFTGRASRSEYWWWVLFYGGGLFIILLLTKLYPLWELGLFIPNLAVGVRRMHDSDHSGWWIICPVANFVFLFFPSTGPNRFDVGATRQAVIDESQLTSTSSACPACGKLRLPGQNYCQGCGAKFE
jgi:hypothetical protein